MSANQGTRVRGSPAAGRSPPGWPPSRPPRPTRSCWRAARLRPGAPRRRSSPPAPRSRVPSPRGCGSRPTRPTWPSATSSSRRSIEEVEPEGRAARDRRRGLPRTRTWPRPPPRSASPRSPRRAARRPPLRPPRLQPGAADEAGRGLLPRRRRRRPREGAGLVRGARQDRGRGSRPGRLRRQPPALPLPLRRRADDRADRHGGRRGRHLHEARRRPPDGPAGAARLRRARRRRGDRRRPLRRLLRGRPQAARA